MNKLKSILKNNCNNFLIAGIVLQTLISLIIVLSLLKYANNYMESNYGEWFFSIIEGNNSVYVYSSLFAVVFYIVLFINAAILYFVSNILLIVGKINKSNICLLLGMLFSLLLICLIVFRPAVLLIKFFLLVCLLFNLLGYIGKLLK